MSPLFVYDLYFNSSPSSCYNTSYIPTILHLFTLDLPSKNDLSSYLYMYLHNEASSLKGHVDCRKHKRLLKPLLT